MQPEPSLPARAGGAPRGGNCGAATPLRFPALGQKEPFRFGWPTALCFSRQGLRAEGTEAGGIAVEQSPDPLIRVGPILPCQAHWGHLCPEGGRGRSGGRLGDGAAQPPRGSKRGKGAHRGHLVQPSAQHRVTLEHPWQPLLGDGPWEDRQGGLQERTRGQRCQGGLAAGPTSGLPEVSCSKGVATSPAGIKAEMSGGAYQGADPLLLLPPPPSPSGSEQEHPQLSRGRRGSIATWGTMMGLLGLNRGRLSGALGDPSDCFPQEPLPRGWARHKGTAPG